MLVIALFAALGLHRELSEPSKAYRELVEESERASASDPCQRRTSDGWEVIRWRECLPLGPPQRMSGVWYYGFEESGFVPNVRSVPLVRHLGRGGWRSQRIYLDVDIDQVTARTPIRLGLPCTTAIALQFIGRRAVLPDTLEVRPGADELIAVDRVIAARRVGIVRTTGMNKVCPKRN